MDSVTDGGTDINYNLDESTNEIMSISNNNAEKRQVMERVNKMGQPHAVMQDRLNNMNPLMFGDTIRLPYHI